MSIPTYSRIDDSEIDSESPITDALMSKLRNNNLALFGVDTVDTAPVVAGFPALEAYADHVTELGTELTVSSIPYDIQAAIHVDGRFYAIGSSSDGNIAYAAAAAVSISSASVVFSGASPTHIRIGGVSGGAWSAPNTSDEAAARGLASAQAHAADSAFSTAIPITNTWTTVVTASAAANGVSATVVVQAKARATSSAIYLQLRCPSATRTALLMTATRMQR